MAGTIARETRQALDSEALDLFWQFVTERQRIWDKRVVKEQSPPWTEDEILQKYRFTNVYRRLDPGTQYVIQDILEADESRRDKILNVMIYRLIGRLETHKYIGFQHLDTFNAGKVQEKLKHRRDNLEKPVFTGAYMVSGYNHMGSSDKVENVTTIFKEIADEPKFFEEVLSAESMEDVYELIRSQPGFGNFLSYQVLVDLVYPLEYYAGDSVLPFSADDWSTPGPGAKKGISVLAEEDNLSHLEIMKWLKQNQQEEFSRLGLDFPFLGSNSGDKIELSLADIQNCLCEFYKYNKILNSNGRARRRFRSSEMRSNRELQSMYKAAPDVTI